MRFTLPRGYLSASSIGMLLNCPKQFEFRYVKGLVIPPGAALVTGSAMHKTLEAYYKDAMNGGARLTGKQAAELAVSSLDDLLGSQENTVTKDEREDAIDSLTGLAELYVDNIAKDIVPLAVEEEVHWTTPGGVPMLAYVDLRRLKDDDEVGICDYKITTKKWTKSKLENSLQFNLYSMMTEIGDIEIHNMIKGTHRAKFAVKEAEEGVKDYGAGMRVLHHVFDGGQNKHMIDLIESAARLITSGVFMPCALDSWCCSPEWCGYWNLCRGKR